MSKMTQTLTLGIVLGLIVFEPAADATRLKDLVEIAGFRPNHLIGMGIVVGLAGTGDDASSVITRREMSVMAKRLGLSIEPNDFKAKNVATVMVTAELPPFARAGMPLDITVSSMGTAKSLAGGTLLITPLKGPDLGTYALAQGSLLIGGFAAEGGSGSSSKKNHTTAGRIPNGARVEKDAPGIPPKDEVVLILREPDFTTSSRIAAAVNAALGEGSARVRDPAAVTVTVGPDWKNKIIDLIAKLESLDATADVAARVIIDERTGTVVAGAGVTLGAAAVAYGGINVEVSETPEVSQPTALSGKGAKTVVTPKSEVKVEEKDGKLQVLSGAATVGGVAAALNQLGVKPRDLAAIFQALKAAGALRAELLVI
jgi:flagellar P-ring protein precursor FlgI